MEITPTSSLLNSMVKSPTASNKRRVSNPFEKEDSPTNPFGQEESCPNTKNPFIDSFIGDIDVSEHGLQDISNLLLKPNEEEEATVAETAASYSDGSSDSASNSSSSDREDDEEAEEEEEVEEQEEAEEETQPESDQKDVEEELQDEPLEDEPEDAAPIKNASGLGIGIKQIKRARAAAAAGARKNNPFGGLAKRLGAGKNKEKEKDKNRDKARRDAATDEKNTKVAKELIGSSVDVVPSTKPKPSAPEPKPVPSKAQPPVPETATRRTSIPKEDTPNHFSSLVLTSVIADIGMAAAEAEAEANGWDVTIAITDTTGIPLQVKRSSDIGKGSTASYEMAVQKAKMASTFAQVTGSTGTANGAAAAAVSSNQEDVPACDTPSQTALVSIYPFLHIGGGVPLVLNGTCCGAVGVSNGQVAAWDQEQDQQVAWAAVKAMADIYWSYQVLSLANDEV